MERNRDKLECVFRVLRVTSLILYLVVVNVNTVNCKPDVLARFRRQVPVASGGSSTTPDYVYYFDYDPSQWLKLGTDYCEDKISCSDVFYQTFPDKHCYCDKLCGLMNDCCGNVVYENTFHMTPDQFACIPLAEIMKNKDYGIYAVAKCSKDWQNAAIQDLCESYNVTEDILLRLPVSDRTELGMLYKNMYCAQCNYVYDFDYWRPEMKCLNDTGVRTLPDIKDCDMFFIRPRPELSYRTCQISPHIISNCSNYADNIYSHNCTEGTFALVYDAYDNAYRNKYCAMCNDVSEQLYCERLAQFDLHGGMTPAQRKVYSLRLLVDFNEGTIAYNEEEKSNVLTCQNNELYDAFSQICREIFCAPPSVAENGKCVLYPQSLENLKEQNSYESLSDTFPNCTLTKLNPSEYEFTNDSNLFIISQQKVYTRGNFLTREAGVFICAERLQKCLQDCNLEPDSIQFDLVESTLTLAGFTISIVSLIITFIIYVAIPKLLNVPGKILLCLVISLVIAQILFLISAEIEKFPKVCTAVGVLVHYSFLAAFCWMNIIALDLWLTFSNRFISSGSGYKKTKRFLLYSLYGWLVPLFIVTSAVATDFATFAEEFQHLKPRYGQGVCWMNSKNALILFFAGPLALFKLFDTVSFVFTAFHIAKAKRQGAMATQKKNACSCLINLKLSLIMGLTWVFAFVAVATNELSMWYLFIIFNSLQGLFIAISFLCTKRVCRLLRDKYEQVSTKSNSGTQLTSVS